jgi:hypothetical protein
MIIKVNRNQIEKQKSLKPIRLLTLGQTIRVNRRVNSTSELGGQRVVLTPGASSTCNGNACCCCSCW